MSGPWPWDQKATEPLSDVRANWMRGSMAAGFLLVFVDCPKELPATLLLRPFNYNTLATRVHEKASLEQLEQASPAALLVKVRARIDPASTPWFKR